jgi:hypothetical protein
MKLVQWAIVLTVAYVGWQVYKVKRGTTFTWTEAFQWWRAG